MNTKKRVQIIYRIAAVSLLLFIGCGNNNSDPFGGCGVQWTQEFQNELAALGEASTAFGNNPTVQSCEAYKDAYRDYFRALENISTSCIPDVSRQEYQEMLVEAENSLNEIDCTQPENN